MARYIANPVEVDAWPIKEIRLPNPNLHPMGDISLILDDPIHKHYAVLATPEMVARITPQIGDYWVVQSDGYTYINPKAVFERKYRKVPDTPPTIEELDKILNSEDEQPVRIWPDGSITAE